jgi:hypothetical protein
LAFWFPPVKYKYSCLEAQAREMDALTAFESVVRGLHDIQTTQYAQAAASVIVIWDHAITFSDEIDLIWKSSWTLGKILFLLNRYYSLAAVLFNNYAILSANVDDSFCLTFFRWQGWTGLISCFLAEAILQMRLYALYSLNKKILAIMLTCWVGCLAASSYIMYTVLARVGATAIYIPGGLFCVPSGVSTHFYTFWIPMLTFESLLCTLALIRGFQTYRAKGSLFHSSRQLVGILIRDSVLYFLVICATYLTCLLVWVLASVDLLGVPIGFSLAFSCCLANRVVLNVRAVNRELNPSRQSSTDPSLYAIDTSKNRDIYADSHCLPGTQHDSVLMHKTTLSGVEMDQLRSMRAENSYINALETYYDPEDPPFVVL